jgi:hypothetical protein
VVSVCGSHLLGDRLLDAFVARWPEPLTVELVEMDAVGLVGDEEVEGRQTGVRQLSSPGKRPITLVRRWPRRATARAGWWPPPPAVAGRVAQVHDERVQIVGQALGRVGEAALVELVDKRLEPLLCIAFVARVVERPPVGLLDPFALWFGQLGVEVAGAVHAAALAVRRRPTLLDPFDQPGAAAEPPAPNLSTTTHETV